MQHVFLPVEPHVLKILLAHQQEEHYFISEADVFGLYLFRVLLDNPVDRRREAAVATWPGKWEVHLGSYAAWGLKQPTAQAAYLFNTFVHKFMLRELHGYVEQALDHRVQAKHAIQAFMAKYGLLEEDIQFETLQKSWQRYWSGRKASQKRKGILTPVLPLKELEKGLRQLPAGAVRAAQAA